MILTGRDESRLEKASRELQRYRSSLDVLYLDAADPKSITRAASRFGKLSLKLDVLINNAAISHRLGKKLINNPDHLILETFQVNGMGPLKIAREFVPLMNTPSRIINISSGGGSMTDPVGGWSPAYCVSKSLLNAITRHLAHELDDRQIAVNAVCPGWVKTDMGGRLAPRSVEQGAETIVWMATTESIPSGKFFRDKKVIPW